MSKYFWHRVMTFTLMAGLLFGAFQPLSVAATPASSFKNTQVAPDGLVQPGGPGVEPQPLTKLDSELRALAQKGGAEPVEVYILARQGSDLSRVAEVTEVRPFPGGELVVAKVTPDKISKMASHPDVYAAEVFHAIEAPIPLTPEEDVQRLTREKAIELRAKVAEYKANPGSAPQRQFPAGSGTLAPANGVYRSGADLIGAPKAWDKGFTGQGVNIAIIDSGVDFGHPDLEGKEAFYESGPYEGWPIALDPHSMRNYYYEGLTSWDNYDDGENYSWYARVDNIIRCIKGQVTQFDFDGITYYIDTEIIDLSLSGEIRWSAHPDIQLADYVSPTGEWMPFIMVDTQQAGVYDTIIADLNYDKWFDQYDDTASLGTIDPVLSQDLGSYVYTDTVVLTGTQYVPSALWWEPPLWYGRDVAAAETTLPAGTFIYALDHNSGPDAYDGADGVADVSGGMVYYIADGVRTIPGMDYLYPGVGPAGMPPVPFNGWLAAFMLGSDYADGGDHGTLCASAAAAGAEIKGYFGAFGEFMQYAEEDWSGFFGPSDDISQWLPFLKPADRGTVEGPAPGASIIAMGANYEVVNGMQGFYDAYTFLAYGVDGAPNSGDEFVDIGSMSYGDGSVHNDGWDWESRLLTYFNQNYLPNTAFLTSSGNGGHGYGTVNSPGNTTAIKVGASTQYGATTVFGSALENEQINDGEVQPFSGRGPDALGRPTPHVLATGAWGTGDAPLNMFGIYNFFFSGGWFPGDGNNAWYEWGGTSRSAPEAAGVLALVYQAYNDANGSFPDFETARQILMSSADDLKHDVLMQGAGRVNADRATDVAGNSKGVYVSPSFLAAGEYQGQQYESFANVLYPGDTWNQVFSVRNTGTTARTVNIGDEVLLEMETLTYTQVVAPWTGLEDNHYPENYYYYADYFVGADPGSTQHGPDLAIPVPAGADLMQVELVFPFEMFDFSYNDPDPDSISYNISQRWSLTVYDWTDRDGDGYLWADTSGDGIVNPQDAGDELDISWTGPTEETEINRFAYSYNYANQQEVTVRLSDREDIDNILIGLVHRNPNDTRPGWGMDEYEANPMLVKVVFYQKADWDLVTENKASLYLPAGTSNTFLATFNIPADQPPGLYEGAITLNDGAHLTLIPTTVNVAVPGDELLFTLGGTEKAGTPYDNGRMAGGYQWSSVLEEGDWRYYYYDAASRMEQQYLYVRNQWGQVCDNMPTFNETLVWGPNPGEQFSQAEPEKYGPYGMQFAGGTPYANTGDPGGWYGPRVWAGWWTPDGPQPESRAWATLWEGLNQVQFRNVLLSGKQQCGEGYEATAGVLGVDLPQTGLVINSGQLSGSFTVDFVSPVDSMFAYAAGFGEEQWFRNQDVPQGRHSNIPPDDLMDGWVYTFEATNVHGIEVWTYGLSSDIDLYLLYDANNDGFFNVYDNRELLDWSTNGGPYEHLFFDGGEGIPYVEDGTYAVVMYGYWVEPGDQFDLQLRTYDGDDLSIEGANNATNWTLSVTPGQVETATVNWQVPESDVWYGYLWFGMPWEEEPQWFSQGPDFYIPVTINAGGVNFARSTKEVDLDKVMMSTSADDDVILTYTITLVNDGADGVSVDVADLLPSGVEYLVQYINEGANGFEGTYVAKWWAENGEHGYFGPDGEYIRWSGFVGPGISNKIYIEYKVKVKIGFYGTITNKADIKVWDTGEFLSRTATTEVFYPLFLPIIGK